ncbi:MAG: hypothetical protein E7404_08500 [Ruminococcaceae bacterium]|nr:hypothetical protein [Oscillospiraceae bacterium]
MKKILIMCGLVVLIIAILFIVNNHKKDFNSVIAVMCEGEEYTEIYDIGYLTITFNDNKFTRKTIQVKNNELKSELSSSNVNDIIGANVFVHIPYKIIKEKHMYVESLNSLELMLNTSEYDMYYEIADVSYR